LVSLTILLKYWQPKHIFRFENEEGTPAIDLAEERKKKFTIAQIAKAWSPFAILTAMVTVWSIKPFKDLFAKDGALADLVISIKVPFLHQMVQKMPPVVPEIKDYDAIYKFDWFSATGTAIVIAAIITIIFLKMKPKEAIVTFGETVNELKIPIYSIGMVLAFAFIANYSGMSATLALALAHTGQAFTFFSPFLGWLGVFLTGSDTSANALFSALQATTAQQIGVPEVLLVAANTSGGVTGKMISPQSIAIACAAVGLVGKESDLFRFTVKHSISFTVMIGIIITLQAYVFPWMIP
jgi:L-lactate permease